MRYYFDRIDGEEPSHDKVGVDLADDNAAIDEALRTLSDWAKGTPNEPGSRALMVIIRDQHREIARLTTALEIAVTIPARTI